MHVTWSVEHGLVVRRFGGGSELVWIHGLGEWSVSFDAIARHPRFTAFTHFLVDLPGYGRSAWPAPTSALATSPRNSVQALADHVAAWLAARPPAILVGHSMGGVIATLVAEQIPVRAVVDIDGNLTRGDCTFSAEAAAYTLDEFRARGFAVMRDAVYARGATEPALRGYHAALLAADPEAFHRNAKDLVALSEVDDLALRLAKLACPALFVAGVPGGVCERSRARLDEVGARWVGIAPSGHWPYVDQPDAVAAALADFLATV